MQIAALTPAPPPPTLAPLTPNTPAHRMWRTDIPTRPAYAQDVAQLHAHMARLAADHPAHARLLDIGDSARKERGEPDGHDIHALVLGAHPNDPAVPRVLLTAGVHARETANPALLMEWATRTLAAAAAGDPARRALLDTRTVILAPMVNPDSHQLVLDGLDSGHPGSIWRRTNQRTGGGVDLNRNFDNRWGSGGTAHPRTRTYRGPGPASEPETRAIQQLGLALRPAAVYDLHSPGGVVLGSSSSSDARRAAQLVTRATGYRTVTSPDYWPAPVGGATLAGWARDQLGATALTIETGAVHHQNDAQYADTLARMLPALDALVATIDGVHEPPAAARALATPSRAAPFIPIEHLHGVTVEPWDDSIPDPSRVRAHAR